MAGITFFESQPLASGDSSEEKDKFSEESIYLSEKIIL
jgi:hypothetical protein